MPGTEADVFARFCAFYLSCIKKYLAEAKKPGYSPLAWLDSQNYLTGGERFWNDIQADMKTTLDDVWSTTKTKECIKISYYFMTCFQALLKNTDAKAILCKHEPLSLLFIFDEGRELTQLFVTGYNSPSSFFEVLRSAMTFPVDAAAPLTPRPGFYTVILDTFPRVMDFLLDNTTPSSYRPKRGPALFPPVYLITFWNMNRDDTVEKKYDSDLFRTLCDDIETYRLDLFYRFGRPLWKTCSSLSLADLLRVARRKLLGTLVSESIRDRRIEQALALVDSRLWLFTQCRFELAEHMVSSHMATALYLAPQRDYILQAYPSEPILAEAAAGMMSKPDHSVAKLVPAIIDLVKQGMVQGGVRGELLARLLLMMAWDVACIDKGGETNTNHGNRTDVR
jgi:hypothetical protein